LSFCTATDFSAAEKAGAVKFCIRVGLLSGQVFSPFGEDWLAGSHGGGGISRRPGVDRRFVRLSSMVTTVGGHWELRAAALLKAVWSCKPADALVLLLVSSLLFFVWFRAAD